MNSVRTLVPVCLLVIFLTVLSAVTARAQDWKPISPAELAQSAPIVEAAADAEVIFWEVTVDDSSPSETSLRHYVRVKVFNDRGRETYSKIDISSEPGNKIKDVAARVINPDGTIVQVKKDDIFDRTIAKAGGEKQKATSFAVPGVGPGVMVEYRYREVVPSDGYYITLRFVFQRELPVQRITFYVKPFAGEVRMKYLPFNVPADVRFAPDKNGFSKVSMTNLAPLREEPRMPPLNDVRPWMLIYYSDDAEMTNIEYWKKYNSELNNLHKDEIKPNDDIKRAAAEITAGASTPDEKLAKLYDYCRTQIKNLGFDTTMTLEEKIKVKNNKTAGDTFNRKVGWGGDIDMLFAALANALGMEARVAWTGDRGRTFFSRLMSSRHLVHAAAVGVKVGEVWKFFNPGARFIQLGMLDWTEEGQDALMVGAKEVTWAQTPLSDPARTRETRTAKFKLNEDGTLEGDVRIEYTGQLGFNRKVVNFDDSPTKQEESLREEIKDRMSTAELADIKIENVSDPNNPFVYSFKIRVPGYAQRTGKRLFFQPGFFEHGGKTQFTAKDRKYDVYFHYGWSEEDDITFELPDGFTLDNADVPVPITPQKTNDICALSIKMSVSNDKKTLIYKRSFFFGGRGVIQFPVTSYAAIKNLFDMFRTADDHSLALRQQ